MHTSAAMTEAQRRSDFQALFQRHRGIVFKVAHSYARHPEDRADLVQEIAAQLWRSFPEFDPARSFTTWMYRVALNVAISHVRTQALRLRHDGGSLEEAPQEIADAQACEPGEHHAQQQQVALLQRFIQRQPPLERALLLLYLDERPQREIASVLGLSETNVSTRIGRLKQRLRDAT